ncbi:hypothetical protein F4553_007532 [Allocatelliglobosispora scoriae]|uniref:Sulfotransferase family protein n=1 Tax=Allocatelliglobosispora scoriae TaxID=643052 RepID=A0A841C2V5_9ACTN|nr:sulfotransferase [Allocatelliglobosispora scoriae]MBB5874098.1 hypothetical protein [Allocatelliglobosispora scoriae]
MSTRVLFVSGFHRSGTTLVTAAATESTGGATLTVGQLARHIPTLERFLRAAGARQKVPDRGVDRLPVTESTPEEYGWLLHHVTGDYGFGERAARDGILESLVAEIAAEPGTGIVILKNPWDTGRERELLRQFPDARILLVRRGFASMEESMARAWERYVTSSGYLRALMGDRTAAAQLLGVLMDPAKRAAMVARSRWRVRRSALRLAFTVASLPPDRVAYLSYDELRADPGSGAAWAAHVLDPAAFAASLAAHTFPEYNREGGGDRVVRLLDALLERAWRRARRRQVRAGLLAPPAGRPRS